MRNEETQLEEEPVRTHEGPRHPRGQACADPRLRQEGHGMAAPQAQTVQHHLQEDHVRRVRPVQVTRAKGAYVFQSRCVGLKLPLDLAIPVAETVPPFPPVVRRETVECA